jgi:holo-[acyl-carrier protein] synthase
MMDEWNIGVDTVEVARFRRSDYFRSKRFYERTFTPREIQHCLSFGDPAPHFAANFAAKEAVYKAISKFQDVRLNWVEILRDKVGAPYVNIVLDPRKAKDKSREKNLPFEIKISLSHSALHAVAFAIVGYSGSAMISSDLRTESGVL